MEVQRLQHAKVAPRSVIELITTPVDGALDTPIDPWDLLRWPASRPISEFRCNTIVRILIAKMAHRRLPLLKKLTGVRIPESADSMLSRDDLLLVQQFQASDVLRDLAETPIGEFARIIDKPLPATLRLLAKLEALDWTDPGPRSKHPDVTPLVRELPAIDSADPIEEPRNSTVDAQLREAMTLPWLAMVKPDDLRFAYPSTLPLGEYLAEMLATDLRPAGFQVLVAHLLLADRLTLWQEMFDLVWAAASRSGDGQRVSMSERRGVWVQIAHARLAYRHRNDAFHESLGRRWNKTRETIRQIIDRVVGPLTDRPPMAPVLQDVLVRVARLQNEAPDVADRELAPYLGDVSIEAAMSFGRLIGVAGDASERIYRTNGAGIRLRKMFAVADELTLEEIAVPLGPDEDAVKRGEVLPAHVLRAYLLGLPWIAIGPTGGFIMTEERRPNVLNEAERIACNVIRHCGGVATRREIGKSIEMAGYTSGFVAKLVREAITLRELEPGLYVSVGNPPEADAVDSARSRLPSKRAAIVIGDASSLSKTRAAPDMLGFAIRVTAATMRNQGYEIPVRFQHRFPVPGQIKLVDGQTVEISSSKRFLRLHRLYPGMEPGDHFWVSVRSDAVAIELVKAERTTGQASGTTEAEVE